MKVIEQCVTLDHVTDLSLIKKHGQKCYQSESSKSDEQFTQMLINLGHESVLEHSLLSVSVVTDRGISHEIVRHRVGFSYSQESTRYVTYGDICVIDQDLSGADFDTFEGCILSLERAYCDLLDKGHKPQVARSLLPTCLKTEIGISANFRAWRNYLKLRLSPKAPPLIRVIAREIYALLPLVVVSDICLGCGCKPYRWVQDKMHRGVYNIVQGDVTKWDTLSDNPPKDRFFPLCKCDS